MVEGQTHLHNDEADAILNMISGRVNCGTIKIILAATMQDQKPETPHQFVFGKN